jgi:hypothetical protein
MAFRRSARLRTIKVFAVIDASGTYSKMAQEITGARGTRPVWSRWIRRRWPLRSAYLEP